MKDLFYLWSIKNVLDSCEIKLHSVPTGEIIISAFLLQMSKQQKQLLWGDTITYRRPHDLYVRLLTSWPGSRLHDNNTHCPEQRPIEIHEHLSDWELWVLSTRSPVTSRSFILVAQNVPCQQQQIKLKKIENTLFFLLRYIHLFLWHDLDILAMLYSTLN